MSDARISGAETAHTNNRRRPVRWRRRSSNEKARGGQLYGRVMSAMVSRRARAQCARTQSAQTDAGFQESADQRRRILDAVRHIRRKGRDAEAIQALCAAIAKTAVEVGIEGAISRSTVFAASRVLLGRNVELAGPPSRAAAVAIAACAAALLGERIHILSTDDARAKALLAASLPLYRATGVAASHVENGAPAPARRMAYESAIVHASAASVAGDHLSDLETAGTGGASLKAAVNTLAARDREAGRLIQPGADRLILDEADQSLANSGARMVTISGDQTIFERTQFAEEAIAFARRLEPGADFDTGADGIVLTAAGSRRAARAAHEFSPLWSGERRREATLIFALRALHEVHPDKDYRVEQDRIVPVRPEDAERLEETMSDCSLKLMLEARENILDERDRRASRSAPVRSVLAQYRAIGGVSCPGAELAGEFWQAYRLPSIALDHLDEAHEITSTKLLPSAEEKPALIAERTATLAKKSKRVLIIAARDEVGALEQAVDQPPCRVMSFADLGAAAASDPEGEPDGADEIIFTTCGRDDELWRRRLETVRAVWPEARVSVMIARDDPVFDFLPENARPAEKGKRFWLQGATGILVNALGARRRKFSEFRLAQASHFKTIDRVLAFSGGAGGG